MPAECLQYFLTSTFLQVSFCFEILVTDNEQFQAMEKEGVIQSLEDILDSLQLDIEAITTDEHSDEMKTNPKLTYFKHQFDHCAL